VKTPRTEIEIKGDVSDELLQVLQDEFGDSIDIREDVYINPFKTNWYQEVKESLAPGDYLKTDRENRGISQSELGSALGKFSRQYISDLEHGRKNISLPVAKKLADFFDRPVNRYI
jgi:DNA-binding XRE family transcriptional regulator